MSVLSKLVTKGPVILEKVTENAAENPNAVPVVIAVGVVVLTAMGVEALLEKIIEK